jgi:hypothetical protein
MDDYLETEFEGLTYKQIAQNLNGGRNPITANKLSVSMATLINKLLLFS